MSAWRACRNIRALWLSVSVSNRMPTAKTMPNSSTPSYIMLAKRRRRGGVGGRSVTSAVMERASLLRGIIIHDARGAIEAGPGVGPASGTKKPPLQAADQHAAMRERVQLSERYAFAC